MRPLRIIIALFLLIVSGIGLLPSTQKAHAAPQTAVSAYDLILAMNTLRTAYGLPALVEDPIVNAVAQATAQTMAANLMSWHIGNVRGRLASAGYGGGATVWATENFAIGRSGTGIDEIMAMWADPDHMRPAVEAAYCHVGAGVAQAADGRIYYILQAAYISGQACGSYSTAPAGSAGSGAVAGPGPAVGLIAPVKIATPDAEGKVYHVVQPGQSLWSIAIAYQLTIRDLEVWNNVSRSVPLQTGQRLFIPGKDTVGYATPTPKGMMLTSTPDADGRIVHEVQAYQTLLTISSAYNVSIERILALNGIQADWPLQIGQKLLISPGNITPSPTLSAIQRLTPEADGRYYHTVASGQTLSWIATRYDVPLNSLLSWNGLSADSIIRPGQKLLLMVTPPATPTATPAPPTVTPSLFPTPTRLADTATPLPSPAAEAGPVGFNPVWIFLGIVALAAGIVFWVGRRVQRQS